MMRKDQIDIDYGLDTKNGRAAQAKKAHLAAFLAGDTISTAEESETSIDSIPVVPADLVPADITIPNSGDTVERDPEEFDQEPVVVRKSATPRRRVVQQEDDENVIHVKDSKIPVVLTVPCSANAAVTMEFAAASVQEDDTGISVLFKADFSLKLPVMHAMKFAIKPNGLNANGSESAIMFVGGMHKLGQFMNVSFIKINDQNQQ